MRWWLIEMWAKESAVFFLSDRKKGWWNGSLDKSTSYRSLTGSCLVLGTLGYRRKPTQESSPLATDGWDLGWVFPDSWSLTWRTGNVGFIKSYKKKQDNFVWGRVMVKVIEGDTQDWWRPPNENTQGSNYWVLSLVRLERRRSLVTKGYS